MEEEYIQQRQETIMKYAQTRDIYMGGSAKAPERVGELLATYFGGAEVNYYSIDAAEALTSQVPEDG
jgi:hypothetical protein